MDQVSSHLFRELMHKSNKDIFKSCKAGVIYDLIKTLHDQLMKYMHVHVHAHMYIIITKSDITCHMNMYCVHVSSPCTPENTTSQESNGMSHLCLCRLLPEVDIFFCQEGRQSVELLLFGSEPCFKFTSTLLQQTQTTRNELITHTHTHRQSWIKIKYYY